MANLKNFLGKIDCRECLKISWSSIVLHSPKCTFPYNILSHKISVFNTVLKSLDASSP